jgi:hypothetical protein
MDHVFLQSDAAGSLQNLTLAAMMQMSQQQRDACCDLDVPDTKLVGDAVSMELKERWTMEELEVTGQKQSCAARTKKAKGRAHAR